MKPNLLLVKSISLLYRESQLDQHTENSVDLVRTAMDSVKISDIGIGLHTDRERLLALKQTVMDMCNNPIDYEYDISGFLQQIQVNVDEDNKLLEAIRQGVEPILTEAQLKRTIINLRRSITTHFKEEKISEILNKASYRFRVNRDSIKDIGLFISEVIGQLEPLQNTATTKDTGVISDVDIGDEGQTQAVFKTIRDNANGHGILSTGWQRLNRMLQGGFRRGEFCTIGAQQHNYKTGFTLSIFKQIALHNNPYLFDITKKPLLLRISFEDDLAENLQFLYQLLYFEETKEEIDLTGISVQTMSEYIKRRLQVNGFHIKMMRVDPFAWSYKNICNKIIELEANGYEVQLLMLDYLGMVPTTGCASSGPIGTDLREMFRRLRVFCGPKKITLITPHQLSTDTKTLVRNGMPQDQFVKEVAEKGYWAGSKQLCQEIDLEMHIHLVKVKDETYLSVQRGKHRLPTILPNVDKYFLLKFPGKMPIPDDVDQEDSGFSKLPTKLAGTSSELFSFI
jgi:hypothetical protein